MKTLSSAIATLAGSMLLAGCSTPLGPQHAYPEPHRPTSELALVRSGLPQYRDPGCPVVGVGTIQILAVDDRPAYKPPLDPPRSVYVLPGERTVTVNYITGPRQAGDTTASEIFTSYSGQSTVKLNLAAGEIVRLDAAVDPANKRFAVVPTRQSPTDCWPGDK